MRRTAVVGMVASGLMGSAATARADEWSLHVLGNAIGSWSDNILSQQDSLATADVYYQLRPGALFSYETHRAVHELTYDLEANFYQDTRDAYSYMHRAGWRGFFMTGPRSEMSATVSFATGTTAALVNAAVTPGATTPGVPSTPGSTPQQQTASLVGSKNTFLQADAGETYHYSITRRMRLNQTGLASRFETHDDFNTTSTTTQVGTTVGVDQNWPATAIGFNAGATFVHLQQLLDPPPAPPGDPTPSSSTLNASLTGTFRRDLSMHWSFGLDAGGVALIPLGEDQKLSLQPTAGAQLSYAPVWGNANLSVRRGVAPNPYIAQQTVNDSATLSLGLPLPFLAVDPRQPRMSIHGSAGYQRSQLLDLMTDTLVSGYQVYSADVALNYAIDTSVGIGIRYEYVKQDASAQTDVMVPTTLVDYTRNVVQIAIFGRWPSRLAGGVPNRDSSRVDRSDVTAVGDEETAGSADIESGGGDGGDDDDD